MKLPAQNVRQLAWLMEALDSLRRFTSKGCSGGKSIRKKLDAMPDRELWRFFDSCRRVVEAFHGPLSYAKVSLDVDVTVAETPAALE